MRYDPHGILQKEKRPIDSMTRDGIAEEEEEEGKEKDAGESDAVELSPKDRFLLNRTLHDL